MALAVLTIDINTRLANIEQDLGKVAHMAEQSAQRMGSAFTAAKAAFGGLAAAFSVSAITENIRGIIDLGDEMNDLSQRVGISVKDLGTWTLAANQSGTSLESLAKGVKGLSSFMVENGKELRKAGITATDANGALIQLADLFAALPDGVEKTALAVKLLGKAGMDMIPVLNQGSQGLREAAEKSKIYGERMAVLAPLADKFNDQLATMALQSKVFGLNLAISILPTLTRFAEQLQAGKEIAGGWVSAMWEFGVLLDPTKGIVGNLNETRVALEKLHAEMSKGMAQNIADGGLTDLSDIDRNIKLGERRKKYLEFLQRQSVMENAAKLGDYRDARDLSQSPDTLAALKAAKALLGKDAKPKKTPKEGGYTDYAMRINEAVASAINSSDIVKAAEFADKLAALDKLFFDSGLDADIYASALERLARMSASASDEQAQLAKLIDATPTAQLEKSRAEMQLLAKAFEDGRISEEQFSEAALTRLGQLGEAVDATTEFVKQAARNMQDAMAEGFFDIMQGRFDKLGENFKATLDRMVANAIAADLANRLLGDIAKTGKIGGWAGDLLGTLFKPGYGDVAGVAAGVPQFAEGTPYVPNTGLALIHQGERIIPAAQNRGSFGGNIIIHVNGAGSAQDVRRAAGQGAREALAAFSGAQRYV